MEVGIQNPGLLDILSRTDPNGNIATIIEVAEKSNPIIADATYVECNDGAKHRHVIRTGIPEPAFRRFNQGVQPSKSETATVQDTTGMLEDYSEVDKALADMSGNASGFRASEVAAKVQGFNQTVARNVFYGSTLVTPEGFMGLAPRFSDPTVASGRQIVDAGGRGSDNASIWAVTWGPKGANLIYPKGSSVGFGHRDLGESTKEFPDGKLMQIYRDHMRWDLGMTLGDWRSIGRIANIDVSELTKDASAGADLLDLMIDLEMKIDTAASVGIDMNGNLVEGRTVLYVSRTVWAFIRKQILNKSNVEIRMEEVAGKRVTVWGNWEVRMIDALSENEAAVPFA